MKDLRKRKKGKDIKYYVMSNTQAQELKKEQLLELFHFAIIPFFTSEVPRAVTISDSGK